MDSDNRGPAILACAWSGFAICTLVLAARYYTRIHFVRKVSLDDYFIFMGYLWALAEAIMFTISVHYGTGQHQAGLSEDDASEAKKYNVLGQPIGILGKTFSRIAWGLTLWALLSPQQRQLRRLLGAIITVQVLVNTSLFIFIYVQCTPVAKLWDLATPGSCPPPQVQEYYGFTESSIDAATDFFLAIIPAFLIRKLNMKRSVKITLSLTMGLGLFGMVAAIVKTIYLRALGDIEDFSYATAYLLIFIFVEQYVLIIAATIPTLRPLFTRYITRERGSGYASSNANSISKRRAWRSLQDDQPVQLGAMHSPDIELTGAPLASQSDHEIEAAGNLGPSGSRGQLHGWQDPDGEIRKTVEVHVQY